MKRACLDRIFYLCAQASTATLVLTLAFFDAQYFFSIGPTIVERAYAAEVSITPTANTGAVSHIVGGAMTVFTSDQVGYRFFRTATGTNGACVYRKTTDGGASWGSDVLVDAQTDCGAISVWYDQWTPGDSGSNIHIVTMEIAGVPDQLFYNRLDTTSDTLLMGSAPVNVSTNSGQGGTFTLGANKPAIAKGTDGTVYVAISDSSDSYIVECTTNCDLTTGWTETGTNPLDVIDNDFSLLVPLTGGNMMLINRDTSLDDIRSQIWNNTSWSGSWTLIDSAAVDNTTYDVGMSATYDLTTNTVVLAYIADNDSFTVADHDLRIAKYATGSWTAGTALITNGSRGLTNVAVSIDENSSDVYVAYSARTTIGTAASANVYWASSTIALSSWGPEQGPINASADDIYGVDMNVSNDQRLFVSWYEAGPDDILGDTILNTSPATIVSASGTQTATVRASSSEVYLGGQFVIEEFTTGRNVTSVTVSEAGSIDGFAHLKNIRLRYDLDTTFPYNCASESYQGSESQFGSTDANGFSGANGISTFADSIAVSPTQSLCLYPVVDVSSSTPDGATIEVQIANPPTDVLVSGGVTATPGIAVSIAGSSTVASFPLRQAGYHWRNDDGSETTATSATGGSQDTPLTALGYGVPVRLRLSVANDGSTSTNPTTFELQYATAAPTCDVATGWVGVGNADDAFNLFSSPNLTNGQDTTNVSVATGGVTDSDTSFLTPNGGVRTSDDTTGNLTLLPTNFIELEYALTASTSAQQGTTYCFRVVGNGEPITTYTAYPTATIAADVTVSSLGSHIASAEIPESNVYFGGGFVVVEGNTARDVTSVTISETGSIDASTGLANVRLRYDLDTTFPYNCVSESFGGAEQQFGATSSFSGSNGTSSFSGSVSISPTQALCLYVVADVTAAAQSNNTVAFRITNPSTQVSVSASGTVSPSSPVAIASSTVVSGSVVTQTHYHWRNDDGSETTATSATGGEDTPLGSFAKNSPIRLRLGLANLGGTSTVPTRFTLQYGIRVTTCENIAAWTNVNALANDSWDLYDSSNLTHGADTTNISVAAGGVTDEAATFLTPNSGVRETSDTTATTTLGADVGLELEFALTTTAGTPFETDFCFRVVEGGTPLVAYDQYPEISTVQKRDFKVQRGTEIVTGTGVTLTAGVDYDAPATTSNAFVRITNSHHTGAGDISLGGNQNPDDVGAYITNATNLQSSFRIERDTDSVNETRVSWEIVEFIGDADTDNEMIVRGVGTVNVAAGTLLATSSAISGVSDNADVVVFITGVRSTSANRFNYAASQFTAAWSTSTQQAVFERGANLDLVAVSYAVVEFAGDNWNVQRVEHQYSATDVFETESITPVGSINRTFLHTQKRYANDSDMADFGHLVFLSSIGAVSFYLSPLTSAPASHVSVAWVIENVQSGQGAMEVFRSSGISSGGAEPSAISVSGWGEVNDMSNASLFGITTTNQVGANFPRPIAGMALTSTSSYEIWRSDTTGAALDYRTEVVQWPAADVAFRQNYYRFYVDDGNLTPASAWPSGVGVLGENAPITSLDSPLGEGERVRMRLTLRVSNGTAPANVQSFKLQYGLRASTCGAIGTWNDVGAVGSGEIWRGFDVVGLTDGTAISTDPPAPGDLLISVSDRAGTLEEANATVVNPFDINAGEDVEYDFVVEHNGASQRSTYCFRLVRADGTPLTDYLFYPQVRTNGYAPVSEAWRWYGDETSLTPSDALSAENTAPVEIEKGDTLKLRVTVDEINNLGQNNARFRLQFANNPLFTNALDVAATSSCTGSSVWCYADGAGFDNATITESVLSTSDLCTAGSGPGCGTHNESPLQIDGFRQNAFTAQEYEFTVQYQNVFGYYGQVWYFRLYDVLNDTAVPVNAGYSYPSLVGESGTLNFSVNGLPAGTTTEGVVTDVATTPGTVAFGNLSVNSEAVAAHRLTLETSAFGGYRLLLYAPAPLTAEAGSVVPHVAASNSAPVAWGSACNASSSCFGYHAGDDTLDGNAARFAPNDSYAGLSTVPETIMYNPAQTTDVEDILYRVRVNQLQAPGDYTADLVYIAVPTF